MDLMGLLDTELMNRIRKALDEKYGRGEILLFGEPWAADETAAEGDAIMALKKNISHLDKYVGMFCDDTRDAIKGHVFEGEIPGFVNGAENMEEKILNSVKAYDAAVVTGVVLGKDQILLLPQQIHDDDAAGEVQ